MNATLWNSLIRRGLFTVIWLLMVGMLAHASGLRINPTPSLPKGIYRLTPEQTYSDLIKGDLVSFCLDGEFAALAKERGYLQAGSCKNGLRPLLKRLAGLPGEHIDAATLEIRTQDSQGRPIPSVLQSGVIPSGMALVLADHEGSFDSRYFGLVPLEALQRVEPVFISPSTKERKKTMTHKEYLAAAARAAAQQITDDPRLHVPLDPDVADHLGAFQEDAIILADLIEDALLTINGQGEAVYEER